jgi:hypothetical protein
MAAGIKFGRKRKLSDASHLAQFAYRATQLSGLAGRHNRRHLDH